MRHVGTAKDDLDLAALLNEAQKTLSELRRPNQLTLPFPADGGVSGLSLDSPTRPVKKELMN